MSTGKGRGWLPSVGRRSKSLVGGLACRKRLTLRSSNVKPRLP
jgi:hypothetical protein